MVISVFPNYGSGFQAFERARGNRLQAEAARTEMELRERRQQALNRLMGQEQDPRRREMLAAMGDQAPVVMYQEDVRSQEAEAERAGQARDDYYESYNELLPRYAVRYQGAQSDEQRQAILQNAQEQFGILGRRMGYQGVSPDVLERELSSYAPEAGTDVNFQRFNAINPETGREEVASFNPRTRQIEFLGVRPTAGRSQPGFRIITREDGTTEVIYGEGEGVYGGSPRAEAQLDLAGLEGTSDLSRVRAFTADVWSLPAQAFGFSGRTLETAARAAEQAAGVAGLASAILGGDTSGFSQEAVQRANEAFEGATGMSLQEYSALRSEGTFLVGRLLPIVTGDTRFTEMERMITETASGVRNLDDVFGSQSAARGASEAVYGVGLQGQAVRALAAGSEPPYSALAGLDLSDPTEEQRQAINQFVDDLVSDGMRLEDARAMARRIVPIYASHLDQVSRYNQSTLRSMSQALSEAYGG